MSQHFHIQDTLFGLMKSLKKTMKQSLQEKGHELAPMHIRALTLIQKQNRCTANHIVKTMNRDKAQVTRLVKELMAMSLVVKEQNPMDKRSQWLMLTDQGRALIQTVEDVEGSISEAISEGLTDQEMQTFERVITQMKVNLRTKEKLSTS